MKKGNRFRRQGNVKILEKALSIRDALFSRLAVRRGAKRLRKIFLLLLLIIPVCIGIFYGISYTIDKAYSLSIERITFSSAHGFISKEQAMNILGIKESINMATLDASGMEETLRKDLSIASAHIRAELPDTLSIEIIERIPIVYVEMENGAEIGERKKLYMDIEGRLFPMVPEYHSKVQELPVWYLYPGDVKKFESGESIEESRYRPIAELIRAINTYSLTELPRVREIFRPKDWKIELTLEDGAVVTMQAIDIPRQILSLVELIEHARATKQHATSYNVIPTINRTAVFLPAPAEEEKKQDSEKDKKKNQPVRRRR